METHLEGMCWTHLKHRGWIIYRASCLKDMLEPFVKKTEGKMCLNAIKSVKYVSWIFRLKLCAFCGPTCDICATFHAGFPLIIFHPCRMQMHKTTNVKSIKSFIKHLRVSATPACLPVTSTVAFSAPALHCFMHLNRCFYMNKHGSK